VRKKYYSKYYSLAEKIQLISQMNRVKMHGHALAREASQIQSYEQLTWKESSFIGKGSKRRKERMQLDQGSPLNSKKKRKERIVLGQMKLAVSSKNEIDRLTTHGERGSTTPRK